MSNKACDYFYYILFKVRNSGKTLFIPLITTVAQVLKDQQAIDDHKKKLNSGTSRKSQRKAVKLPSVDQSALMAMLGSPVLSVTITPGSTGAGPG